MKVFFLITALLMAPLSFASYHGGEEGGGSNPNNSSGGYGGSDGLAIAGVIALVGGLAYYFTRGAKQEDKNPDGLNSLNSLESKKFVPIISAIPIIGKLFQSTTIEKEQRELLIFITPTIVG